MLAEYDVPFVGSVGAEPAFITTITPSPFPEPDQLMVIPPVVTLEKVMPDACEDGAASMVCIPPAVVVLPSLVEVDVKSAVEIPSTAMVPPDAPVATSAVIQK